MESATLQELTRNGAEQAVPERRAHSRSHPQRERFAPLWLRASLVAATFVTLGLLYPKHYIVSRLHREAVPNAATLAYLHLMVLAQPAATETRILLAQQAVIAGNLPLAHQALAPWAKHDVAALPLPIALLKLRVLRAELYAQPPTSQRHAELAAAYTRDIVQLAPRMDVGQLLRAAHFAAALGQYRVAVDLYQRVIGETLDAARRLEAFYGGIAAWRAAGRPLDALAFARRELPAMPETLELWRHMTRLALLADAPRLAARYARRLIGLKTP